MKNLIFFLLLSTSVHSQEIYRNVINQSVTKHETGATLSFQNMQYTTITDIVIVSLSAPIAFFEACVEVLTKGEPKTVEGVSLKKSGRSVVIRTEKGYTYLSKGAINKILSRL